MRTFNEILDIHIDRSIMSPAEEKAIHAAMKEAREEYFKAVYEWHNEMDWNEFDSYYDNQRPPKLNYNRLFKDFNDHTAAIEAEKERGKG